MKKIRCPNPKCRQRILDDEGRLKNGLSIEGVCRSPLVQDWKIHTMAQKVLHAVFDDPEGTLKKEQGRYETLLDMRMNNEIPGEVFSRPCRRMGSFRKVI